MGENVKFYISLGKMPYFMEISWKVICCSLKPQNRLPALIHKAYLRHFTVHWYADRLPGSTFTWSVTCSGAKLQPVNGDCSKLICLPVQNPPHYQFSLALATTSFSAQLFAVFEFLAMMTWFAKLHFDIDWRWALLAAVIDSIALWICCLCCAVCSGAILFVMGQMVKTFGGTYYLQLHENLV